MKSFAAKFNKTAFGIDTADFAYIKLGELYKRDGADVVHPVNGLFVSKSPLGESPCIIDAENKLLVNSPAHLAATFRDIINDDEAVEAIKNGKVGYTIYEYDSHSKKCYSLNWVDI